MISSYDNLKTRVLDILEDSSTEAAAYVDTAIFLAEKRCMRDLDYYELKTKLSVSYDVNVQTGVKNAIILTSARSPLNLGGDSNLKLKDKFLFKIITGIDKNSFLYFDHVVHDVGGQETKLEYVEYSWIKEHTRYSTSEEPRYYSYFKDPNEIFISPFASTSFSSFDFYYTKQPTHLSSSNTTNEILDKAPDLLLIATVIEMCGYQMNFDTVGYWESRYSTLLDGHRSVADRERRDVGHNNASPSLIHQTRNKTN